jgi:hypothetical protein
LSRNSPKDSRLSPCRRQKKPPLKPRSGPSQNLDRRRCRLSRVALAAPSFRSFPFGIAGRHVITGEIGALVTGFAAHGGNAAAVFAAFYVLQMDVAVVALQGSVACGMAVLAARRSEDFVHLEKGFCGGGRVGFWISWRGVQIRHCEYDQRDPEYRQCRYRISTRCSRAFWRFMTLPRSIRRDRRFEWADCGCVYRWPQRWHWSEPTLRAERWARPLRSD